MNWILLIALACIFFQIEICFFKAKTKFTIIPPIINLIALIIYSILFLNKSSYAITHHLTTATTPMGYVFNNTTPLIFSLIIVLVIFTISILKSKKAPTTPKSK
ncbi:MAG: hypothetical protein RSA99_00210 [Oscillospiraceae bacterium]